MAIPTADAAAQMPSAVARSLGSVNTTRIRDRVVGMIMAPPTPSRARMAITPAALSTNRTSTEASAKTAYPVSSTRLRPSLSARALIGTSRPASTSE
nr:hypothetical protein [Acidipropionibacterium jensenii]